MNNGLEYCASLEAAIKLFQKKFTDKTRNEWEDRENFVASPGKYTLLEMDYGGEQSEEQAVTTVAVTPAGVKVEMLPSRLDDPTQELINLIFDKDMFKNALKKYDIGICTFLNVTFDFNTMF